MVWKTMRRQPAIPLALLTLVVVLVLDATGRHAAARWLATIVVGAFVVWTLVGMIREMIRGRFGLDVLAIVAMAATLLVGEYVAALIIVLMLSGGEALEDFAARRAKRELTALLERSPQSAHVVSVDGEDGAESVRDLPVDDVAVGDLLLIRPSEIVPVDSEMVTDEASFDESSLTGESLPVTRRTGEILLSGAVNGSRVVRARAVRRSADSQYQQILMLVREAQESRAPVVRLADRFAIPFTVVSLLLGGIAWAVSGDAVRFAEVLVLATPCPLLIAAPVAFLGGLSRSAKAGIVLKGGAVIETLSRVRSAAFDKTGTLTRGRPALIDVRPEAGFSADEVLQLAASAEQYSSHALAEGIRAAARSRGLALLTAEDAGEVATNGVMARIGGRVVVVGKPAYVASLVPAFSRTDLAPGEAAAYVAIDGRHAGALVLADAPRAESRGVVAWLSRHGIDRVAMLTGDAHATAASIAETVGIDEVHAELLPDDKVRLARDLRPRPLVMVGDGVNDAPVLAASDVGIAMGAKGATAAGEAADAVILVDSLAKVVHAVEIGRHTVRVALTAIWIGIALSITLMVVAMSGVIPAVAGALIQELVDLATILYALRALRGPLTPESALTESATEPGPKARADHDERTRLGA
ncbi:heavy metal-(Cd/Co/Hg/Pb/Zn)-translocating P-type ATPase [Microbacterium azadirachtae]|nr:heavy metal-(Cd/Co/Hg/Pb/Zn)-translocating P-type ATPase [Microbacterium azadirachtae]SEG18921.1 heavy metal-(Cd/Co/Hg/Pb/Zn)-translocating P-type ATPase [Microbacterium azadirachtae]SEG21254.1 heavy metal-(Cd/Co/Hg/Pb/Zn)-translocating P-type ATPase [Microbacterium azadirachtae]